jgi:hypothetical protein
MKRAIIFMAIVALIGCAGMATQPSKYDGGDYDNCLLYQVAQKHGVRIEDMGNLIRVAGLIGSAEDMVDPKVAIEVYSKIRTALSFQITGEAFVEELGFLAAEYQEILSIAMSYAPDFAVTYTLDEQTVTILVDWCSARIAYYQKKIQS